MSRFDSMLTDFNTTLYQEMGQQVTYRDRFGVESQRGVILSEEYVAQGDYDETIVRKESAVFIVSEGALEPGDTFTDGVGNTWRLLYMMEAEGFGRVGSTSGPDKQKFLVLRLNDD